MRGRPEILRSAIFMLPASIFFIRSPGRENPVNARTCLKRLLMGKREKGGRAERKKRRKKGRKEERKRGKKVER